MNQRISNESERLAKEREKILADGDKAAADLKRKAEKNLGKTSDLILGYFYERTGMKN